ncbi:MAG TPA: hypothetical protein VFV99_22905, partial [Kofleriaceae bacterium]|nr:hypothetical protein [Kofleriaceae bacterium]
MGRPTGIAFVVALTGVAHADITVDPCACSPNKPGFHRASALTGDWGGLRADLFDAGVKVQATYAGELFAAPGLESDRIVNAGLGALALDIDFATLAKIDHLGSLHLAGFAIHGDGLDTR